MILGSHNSWSYIRPKKWYLRPFKFVIQCQSLDIKEQYNYGVRCFDLRIRFDKQGNPEIAHGLIVFDVSLSRIFEDLKWLNEQGDCYVRVIHEARNKKQYTEESIENFRDFCSEYSEYFSNIKFYHGRNLYNWEVDYKFNTYLKEEEYYSSVCPPKFDDWFPRIFAYLNNPTIDFVTATSRADVILVDFVNYINKVHDIFS